MQNIIMWSSDYPRSNRGIYLEKVYYIKRKPYPLKKKGLSVPIYLGHMRSDYFLTTLDSSTLKTYLDDWGNVTFEYVRLRFY